MSSYEGPKDVTPPPPGGSGSGTLTWDFSFVQGELDKLLAHLEDPLQRELAIRVARDWSKLQVLALAGEDVQREMAHLWAQMKGLTAKTRLELVGAARSVWGQLLTTAFDAAIAAALMR